MSSPNRLSHSTPDGAASHYIIGIDLGTTNTAVAYIDTRTVLEGDLPQIVPFDLLQLVAEGKLEALPILPSFLYFLGEHERAMASVRLPWEQSPAYVTGAFARDQGALVPGQLVASAKSWLCHDAVDRTAKILPWGVDQPQQSCSPVEASAHYLAHIREAWNEAIGKNEDDRFERQHLVLTVPASFDAEARELTVQAAHAAGIVQLTLLEEPQAAFYAWSHSHATTLKSDLEDGDLVLICDVGGGTTDLSLIRVQMVDDEITFERTAIGEHILLGGDNVDLALAHRLEAALGEAPLSLRQRQALRRQCCAAKEQLMRQPELEQLPIRLLGSGRSLVGGTLSMDLTREDVTTTLLDGFLPHTVWDDYPERERRVGLRELGLPYASEPAITKHLAYFLTAAANAQTADPAAPHDADMMCPNAILFNGGFFTPALVRERLLDTMTGWFREKGIHHELNVLQNAIPETAVAVGAAYYGHVRRSGGLRIHGGSARAYYMGVQTGHAQPDDIQAVCVLPRGTEEGTTLDLANRAFTILTNQPVTFTLYSAIARQDAHADVVTLRAEEVHRHAPLIAELRFGKKSRKVELPVQLSAHYSEVGTLEIWCESQTTEHRWRLQFQLRAALADGHSAAATPHPTQTKIDEPALQQAERQIRAVFRGPSTHSSGEPLAPEELFAQLESTLGYDRDVWPVYAIRKLCDVLIDSAEGRKKSAQFEARWLHMFGFCLRPGFSVELDDWRIKQARVIYHEGLVHPKNVDCQVQWAVLWRRIAGGLSAGQQHDLYQRHRAVLGLGSKKRGNKRLNGHLEREIWRLLASLERLPAPDRALLGQELLDKLQEQPKDKSYLWAIGRLGARIPFAGPLNCVIPAEVAAAWIEVLLKLPVLTPDAVSAIAQLGAKTDDPARDIEEAYRADILRKLASSEPADPVLQSLREFIPPARIDAAKVFGESLPAGLRLVTAPE